MIYADGHKEGLVRAVSGRRVASDLLLRSWGCMIISCPQVLRIGGVLLEYGSFVFDMSLSGGILDFFMDMDFNGFLQLRNETNRLQNGMNRLWSEMNGVRNDEIAPG